MRESRAIAKRIDDLIGRQKYIKIISDSNEEECINLGDIVNIKMIYDDNDMEYEKVKLTGNHFPNTDNEIQEVTLNSPLGKALFKAKVGVTSSYLVGNKIINFEIISKEN